GRALEHGHGRSVEQNVILAGPAVPSSDGALTALLEVVPQRPLIGPWRPSVRKDYARHQLLIGKAANNNLERAALGVCNGNLVTVFLRQKLRRNPLSCLDAKIRPAQRLTVLLPADNSAVSVALFHPVVSAVVGNVDHFISKSFGLYFSCTRVLGREFFVLCQPPEHSGLVRHSLIFTNRAQAFTIGYALADRVHESFAVIRGAPCCLFGHDLTIYSLGRDATSPRASSAATSNFSFRPALEWHR